MHLVRLSRFPVWFAFVRHDLGTAQRYWFFGVRLGRWFRMTARSAPTRLGALAEFVLALFSGGDRVA